MKGTNLGEFEEVVLLTIAALIEEAYSVAICDEIERVTDRKVKLGVVHAVLNRLEKKGFVDSRYDGATPERGGRRKHLFSITKSGYATLVQAKEQREFMWKHIPSISFD